MTSSTIVIVVSVIAALSLVKSDSGRHPTIKSDGAAPGQGMDAEERRAPSARHARLHLLAA
jgi:hypothetical protein